MAQAGGAQAPDCLGHVAVGAPFRLRIRCTAGARGAAWARGKVSKFASRERRDCASMSGDSSRPGGPRPQGTDARATPGAQLGRGWARSPRPESPIWGSRPHILREEARAPGAPPRRPRPRLPGGGGFPQCPASSRPHFRCPAARRGPWRTDPRRAPPAPPRGAGARASGGARGRAAEAGPGAVAAAGARRGPISSRGRARGAGSRSAGGARARVTGAAGLERARGRALA